MTGSLSAAKMPAGIAAYVNQNSQVRHNLAAADLTVAVPGGDGGTRGIDAGLIVGYPGSPNGSTLAGDPDGPWQEIATTGDGTAV
ncbi:hypothetical protein ABZ897_36545 [Nonomuraea sp. NPDC046802]|uniref:hypothetical protein n=1 Tax=Nonomuraea sp. NPDC046802 TaxID=3154919 RepID=UPI0033F39DB6